MTTEHGAVAAVVLAAGLGRRFARDGGGFKLLAPFDGRPLVEWVLRAALASKARPVVVVIGHEASSVEAALASFDLQMVHNPDFATGLASSLRAGLAALPDDCKGALVLLGDMPRVTPDLLDRLIDAFLQVSACDAIVPTYRGERGNPCVLSRKLFAQVTRLEGDEGARKLLARSEAVIEIAVDDAAVALDIDTPDALAAASARVQSQSAPVIPDASAAESIEPRNGFSLSRE